MNIAELIATLETGTEIAKKLGHHQDISASRGVIHLLKLARDADRYRDPPRDVVMSGEAKARPLGSVSFGTQHFDLSDPADSSLFRTTLLGALGVAGRRPPIKLGSQIVAVRSRRGVTAEEWVRATGSALAIDAFWSDASTRPGSLFFMNRSRSDAELDACFRHVERAAAAHGIEVERLFEEVAFPDGPRAMRAGWPLDLTVAARGELDATTAAPALAKSAASKKSPTPASGAPAAIS